MWYNSIERSGIRYYYNRYMKKLCLVLIFMVFCLCACRRDEYSLDEICSIVAERYNIPDLKVKEVVDNSYYFYGNDITFCVKSNLVSGNAADVHLDYYTLTSNYLEVLYNMKSGIVISELNKLGISYKVSDTIGTGIIFTVDSKEGSKLFEDTISDVFGYDVFGSSKLRESFSLIVMYRQQYGR